MDPFSGRIDELGVDHTSTLPGIIARQSQRNWDVTPSTSTTSDTPEEPFPILLHLQLEKSDMGLSNVFDDIETDAERMLKENPILYQVTEKIGRIIQEIVDKDDRIEISLYSDIELPEWNDFTISVKVRNRTFDERIDLWKKIEDEVESILKEMKATSPQYTDEIESVNGNLTVIVEEF